MSDENYKYSIPDKVLSCIPEDGKFHRVELSKDGWYIDGKLVYGIMKDPEVEIRAFPRALSYEEILKLYKGYRPFHCKRCDLWFMTKSELMKHIWEVHRRMHK